MFKVIATIGGIQALAVLVSVGRTKVQAVWLGPDGIGITSNIDQLLQLTSYISALSLPLVSVKFLSRAHSVGRERFREAYLGFFNAIVLLSIVGTATSMVLVLGGGWGLLAPQLVTWRPSLMVALCAVPTMMLGGFFVNVLAAGRRSTESALFNLLSSALIGVLACGGLILGGITGLYIGNAVAGFVVTVAGVFYLKRGLGLPIFGHAAKVMSELRRHRTLISFAAVMYVTTFFSSLALVIPRQSVLEHHGATEAGLLQAGIAVGTAIYLVLNPTNALFLMPTLNREIPASEKVRAALDFLRKLVLILCVTVGPIVLFPRVIVGLLFSVEFAPAADYVPMFLFGQIAALVGGVFQVLLIGFDDVKSYGAIASIGHVASATLSWLLVPRYGVFGAALGLSSGSVLICCLSAVALHRRYGLPLPWRIVGLAAYGVAAMFAMEGVFGSYDGVDGTTMLLKAAVYVAFAASLIVFLDSGERRAVRQAVRLAR